ncbi:unnamed protein product [Durusdinium trenchii]|uniref:Uncharacterized protein n=2 Tax=Durusdinium trenchii TaxID=1381693 RepID=A0ABP0P642_9DINO
MRLRHEPLWLSFVAAVGEPEPSMETWPGGFEVRPMGLEDIASVFPFTGSAETSDHLLEEFMQEIQPSFRGKLISILASRFPESAHPCAEDVKQHCVNHESPLHCLGLHAQHVSPGCMQEVRHSVPFGCSEEIHRHCSGHRVGGMLRCLEEVGVHLGLRCADAVIAARQALASIQGSEKRAEEEHHHHNHKHEHHHKQDEHNRHKHTHAKHHSDHHKHLDHHHHSNEHHNHPNHDHHSPEHHKHPEHQHHHEAHHTLHKDKHQGQHHSSSCPPGWDGPKAGGCCTRRWSARCNLPCSVDDCKAASGWEFRWADFRTHPYICCPKVIRHQYLGGQQICPSGWEVEEQGHGHCCRKSWSWDCGEHCAFDQCKKNLALEWYPVDDKSERYKCCPEMPAIHFDLKEKTDLPSLVTAGSSLVSRPIDLSSVTFAQASTAGVILGALLICKFALSCWCSFSRRQSQKDQ